jgi:hypothetical protein
MTRLCAHHDGTRAGRLLKGLQKAGCAKIGGPECCMNRGTAPKIAVMGQV